MPSLQTSVSDSTQEPSVLSAVGRAIEAGQRIIVDRVDLAKLDVLSAIADTFRGTALLVFGGLLVGIGWMALSAAAIVLLHGFTFSWAASACLVGGVNLLLGGSLIAVGMHAARGEGPWKTTPNGATNS